MSKQLKLSASVSLLAMLGLILASTPAAADGFGHGVTQFHALASASTSVLGGDLLPLLQPSLQ